MFEDLKAHQPATDDSPVAEEKMVLEALSHLEQPLLPGMVAYVPAVERSQAEPNPAAQEDSVLTSERVGPAGTAEPADLADWKTALRNDFDNWLATIDRIPAQESEEVAEMPDLYSFYEQLALANVETRKANRRTAEAFSQWAETLGRFEADLAPLRESTARLAAGQAKENELPNSYCLVLIELQDRMYRLAKAFHTAPERKSWWGGTDAAWRRAWESQRQGFAILLGHFEELLKKEGVTRIEVIDRPFDPGVMMAVAAEPDSGRPAQMVLEEIAAGYRRRGELLRPAQVKVSARP